MTVRLNKKFQLFYVYDPMCSWCWGYRPTWLALQQAIIDNIENIEIHYLLGGLAPDSTESMPQDMQHFLSQTWKKIANQLGTQFNFDFWQQCKPRRSTYPACRACLIARETGQEQEMIFAIQQAYYLQAKNPSDDPTLLSLATQLGFDEKLFINQLTNPITQQQLNAEIALARSLPIQGFPSLVLSIDGQYHAVEFDYLHWQTSFEAINALIR